MLKHFDIKPVKTTDKIQPKIKQGWEQYGGLNFKGADIRPINFQHL